MASVYRAPLNLAPLNLPSMEWGTIDGAFDCRRCGIGEGDGGGFRTSWDRVFEPVLTWGLEHGTPGEIEA